MDTMVLTWRSIVTGVSQFPHEQLHTNDGVYDYNEDY